jgi:Abnormal spindle-like microcephaly-assoc'd, ASPM-SPD-2-Hydin
MFFLACAAPEEKVEVSSPHIEVGQPLLDFGAVLAGASATKELTIYNTGEDSLSLGIPFLVGGSNAFQVGPLPATVLSPGGEISLSITFSPTTWGATDALLVLLSNDPEQPSVGVELVAQPQASDLAFDPPVLDFGVTLLDCDVSGSLLLKNVGSDVIEVTSLQLSGDDAFEIYRDGGVDEPLPWVIGSGDSRTVRIRYLTGHAGAAAANLAAMDGSRELTTAQVAGQRLESNHIVESWAIDGGKVDIAIPVQDAGASTDVGVLRNGFPDFLDALDALQVDWQMAVIQEADGCANGADPYFTSAMTRNEQLRILDQQLDGTSYVHGLNVAKAMVSSSNLGSGGCNEHFIRPDARIAIVGYTYIGSNHPDEGWHNAIQPVLDVKEHMADIKFHGIIEDLRNRCGWGSHSFWSDAVDMTGGVWYSICDDVPASMLKLAPHLAEPQTKFVLGQVPIEDSILVRLNGATTAAWSWEAADNMVVLDNSPNSGGEVEISYDILNVCE